MAGEKWLSLYSVDDIGLFDLVAVPAVLRLVILQQLRAVLFAEKGSRCAVTPAPTFSGCLLVIYFQTDHVPTSPGWRQWFRIRLTEPSQLGSLHNETALRSC